MYYYGNASQSLNFDKMMTLVNLNGIPASVLPSGPGEARIEVHSAQIACADSLGDAAYWAIYSNITGATYINKVSRHYSSVLFR